MSVRVRPATADDAGAMVAVIREGFAPELLDAMIYGCAGMDRFIRDELELPPGLCDRTYTVAERDGRVLGALSVIRRARPYRGRPMNPRRARLGRRRDACEVSCRARA